MCDLEGEGARGLLTSQCSLKHRQTDLKLFSLKTELIKKSFREFIKSEDMNDIRGDLKMIKFLKAMSLHRNQINLRKSEKCMNVIKQLYKMTVSKGINLRYKQCIKYCIFVYTVA